MKRFAFLWVSFMIAVFALPGAASAEREAYFSLNGQEYSFSPALGDFLENSWEMGTVLETFSYSYMKEPYETEAARAGEWITVTPDEESTVTVTFDSGYELVNDENTLGAYLDQNAVETGTELSDCHLARLGVNAGYVDSFILNGIELADADFPYMEDAFGTAEAVEENEVSVIFSYSLPEVSAQISFVYYGAEGDAESLNQLRDSKTLADEIYLSFGLPAIGDVSFSLNGQDFLIYPTLGDFLESGWELGESAEQIGDWSEEEGPYNVVTSGYYLMSETSRIAVYLDDDKIRAGEDPRTCSLKSLSLYRSGDNAVDSLQIDGYELAGVTQEQLAAALGEPIRLLEEKYGTTCYYSFPECGITFVTVNYSGASGTQSQITISF